MKIITVAGLKGGVGKTNFSFNLANHLANFWNKKILAIDLDSQGTLSSYFNINSLNEVKIKDLFLKTDVKISDLITKTTSEKIDLIENNINSFDLELNLMAQSFSRENFLQRCFFKNETFLEQYDYVIIDTAPVINNININAFKVADSIILISDRSKAGFAGLTNLYNTWQNATIDWKIKNKINAIILNKFNRFKQSEYFLELINKSNLKKIVYEPYILQKSAFEKCETYNKGIFKLLTKKKNPYFELTKNLIKGEVL